MTFIPTRRMLVVLSVLLITGTGSWYWTAKSETRHERYKTQSIDRGDIIQNISANGTLNPVVLVNVGTQVSGTVYKLFANFNDQVKEGQILVELDPSLFEAQLRQSEASVLSDFTVRNLAALAAVATGAAKAMSMMPGAIASVSLLVGGIGIMNIMLVSVTERMREIGIRMAIGANRRVILMQFLLEALVICILGGFVGVALGIGGAWAVSRVADMVVVITFGMVTLAFAFASAVGIFFGFYPAKKAAALKPVEALRYE